MIGQKRFNWAMVLSLLAVLIFCYIAFLGMLYHEMSDSNTPILNALVLLVIVTLCCVGMCYGRSSRHKLLSKSVQIALGAVIFVALGWGAIPFTNFLDVLGKSEQIEKNVEDVYDYASNLDNSYAEYANSRIKDYEYVLSPEVEEPTGVFVTTRPQSGLDYEISLKSQALRRIILPEYRQEIIKERQQWLDDSRGMSLWNVATPTNLRNMESVVTSWIDEYCTLSSNGFEDESFAPFEEKDFTTSIEAIMADFTHYHFPSIMAIFITLVVFGLILLAYFLTPIWDWDCYGSEGGKKEFIWI